VDDNIFNLIPLEVMLYDMAKIKVMKASNGLEAVKLYRQDLTKVCCDTQIKLVLIDLNMPVMDGIKATKAILDAQRQFVA